MILCLGGGTPHKPAITVNGHVLHEAVACADFLLEKVAFVRRSVSHSAAFRTSYNRSISAIIYIEDGRVRHIHHAGDWRRTHSERDLILRHSRKRLFCNYNTCFASTMEVSSNSYAAFASRWNIIVK